MIVRKTSIFPAKRSDVFTCLQRLQTLQIIAAPYAEVGCVYHLEKYGFNIKSQLLKLLVIFPMVSALAAWICTLM